MGAPEHFQALLGASGALSAAPERSQGALGALLGVSGALSGRSWALLGRSRAAPERFGALLGASWWPTWFQADPQNGNKIDENDGRNL